MFQNWWKNLSLEDLSRWVRTLAQFLSGSGFGIGVLTGDKWVAAGGIIVSLLSFVWTLRANTAASLVAEVKKTGEVKVQPTSAASPAVVAAATTKT